MNNQQAQLSPQQKHRIWMKNSGYLYDRLVVHKMKWPSLTFQWLPTQQYIENGVAYQVIVATHTSGQRQNEFINIFRIQFPNSKDIGQTNSVTSPTNIKKVEQFRHQLQPNRVRYNPNNPHIIACRLDNAPITIFRRGNEFPQTLLSQPNLESGFALEWSNYGLISGDHKGTIAVWHNIEQKCNKYQQKGQIQDTKFIDQHLFATVGGDGFLCIWDQRSGKIQGNIQVSGASLYSTAVNPVNKNLILTAGQQGVIKLWDARSYNSKLYSFQGHEKPVLNVCWSPKTPTIFASGGQDSKVKIWDLLRVGFQIPKDNSGTQQLLFTHEGHQDDVLDLGWNPYTMLLGSTEQKFNTLQIYQISNCIQQLEFAEDMDYLREQCLS